MSNLKQHENIKLLIDSHCHLDFPEFDDDRGDIIQQCQSNGIEIFVVPGVTCATWHRLLDVSTQFSAIKPAYGLHPMFINEHQLSHVDLLTEFIDEHHCIAIGEIGLDFYLKETDKKQQRIIFQLQLALARDKALPVILHVRKAHDEVIQLLKKYQLSGGIVHAFNGSFQQARQYIELGFKLGFGGALTYDRAKHLRELAAQLPLSAIVLETDSPDMLPMNHPGSFNTPMTVIAVLIKLSEIRQRSPQEISIAVTRNTKSVLNLQ